MAQRETLRILRADPLQRDLRDFLLDVSAANRSEGTLRFYRQKLHPFLEHLRRQGVEDAAGIRAGHLRAFLADLARDHNPGGVHAYWRAVRAFVRWLVREGILDRDPAANVRAPRVDLDPLDPVDLATVRALLATCNSTPRGLRDRSLLMALLDTGLRAGEATAANVGDLDLTTGALLLRKTKSRRPRVVFLGRKARRAVAAYLRTRGDPAPGDPLWPAYSATGECGRLTHSGLRDIVRRRARAAGVAPPTLHSFRRAAALAMLRGGADPVTVSRLLGHGSLAVTLRYLAQTEEDLKAAHAKGSPVDNLL